MTTKAKMISGTRSAIDQASRPSHQEIRASSAATKLTKGSARKQVVSARNVIATTCSRPNLAPTSVRRRVQTRMTARTGDSGNVDDKESSIKEAKSARAEQAVSRP